MPTNPTRISRTQVGHRMIGARRRARNRLQELQLYHNIEAAMGSMGSFDFRLSTVIVRVCPVLG